MSGVETVTVIGKRPSAPVNDDLVISAGGVMISGWTKIRVTRGVERLPSDFDIEMTERYSGQAQNVVVEPGQSCEVFLGADRIITGYVDRYAPSIAPGEHRVRITGRGKCQDLVDCSADVTNCQISGATALGVAQKLAAPYGVTVTALADPGPPIPQFNIMFSETPFAVIERIARFSAFLAYDGEDGNLILARVGAGKAASGFTQGQNVQSANITYSIDQRFSEYDVYLVSSDVFQDIGPGTTPFATFTDAGVKRFRKHFILSEQGSQGLDIAKQRGAWEASRRYGRSAQLVLTTDSWRDADGTLWQPNTFVTVDIPALKVVGKSWVISEVSYEISPETGRIARLTIMPPEAFAVEPTLLNPVALDIVQAYNDGKSTSAGAPTSSPTLPPIAPVPGTGYQPPAQGVGQQLPAVPPSLLKQLGTPG